MRRCGNSRRKGHDVEAKEFGRFIAGMRKEKKMTQAELAEKIHVTDKAVSRWERGLGFPDIQTIEPLAQALGISVLELMRSERQEKAKEEAAPEIQYTQKEVAEMLQNAGDISRQQKKQDRNANVIAGFLVIGVAAAAWAACKAPAWGNSRAWAAPAAWAPMRPRCRAAPAVPDSPPRAASSRPTRAPTRSSSARRRRCTARSAR